MNVPIKNYTTKVDVYQSLGEIQGALARNGACKIMVDYDGKGKPIGVTFGINTLQGAQGFLLPANIEGVLKVFASQTESRQNGRHGGIYGIGCWHKWRL